MRISPLTALACLPHRRVNGALNVLFPKCLSGNILNPVNHL